MRKKIKIKNEGQMIALMGIVLAISVFMISSLAAEIANVDFIVITRDAGSLAGEFSDIKETFGVALNYNLVDIFIYKYTGGPSGGDIQARINESFFDGDINKIETAFNQTKDEYFNLYFRRGIFFDAVLNEPWYYSHEEEITYGNNTVFYSVDITLYLDDGDSRMAEDVTYLIACTPEG